MQMTFKKIKRIICLGLTAFSLTSCGFDNHVYTASMESEYKSFLANKGESNGEYFYYKTSKKNSKRDQSYAVYNSENGNIGYCYLDISTAYSNTYGGIIETNYLAIFHFFKPGKPWESEIKYYEKYIDIETLQESRVIYTYEVNKKSYYDFGVHEIKWNPSIYKKTMKIIIDEKPNFDHYFNFDHNLNHLISTMQSLHLEHFSTGLPFVI